jgi:hypothetical protein
MAYSADPTLWLYTSLTAGSSHIITATSRLETILKANKIPFRALDVATDEKARMLWGRRAKGRKLPGLVKYGIVIGDLDEIEEWNEYGELKQQLSAADPGSAPVAAAAAASTDATATTTTIPSNPDSTLTAQSTDSQARARSASDSRHISISEPADSHDTPAAPPKKEGTTLAMAMRQAGAEAAAKATQKKSMKATPKPPPTEKEPETAPAVPEPKVDQSMEGPEAATEIMAAKTPTQPTSEGIVRTSVDKVADTKGNGGGSIPGPEAVVDAKPALSFGDHLLQMRRKSDATKNKSLLPWQIEPVDAESETAIDTISSPVDEPVYLPMRTHRGSSLSVASKEEILEIERRNMIVEESEEDSDEPVVEKKTQE